MTIGHKRVGLFPALYSRTGSAVRLESLTYLGIATWDLAAR